MSFTGSIQMIFFSMIICTVGSQGANKMAAGNFLWLHFLNNRSSIQFFLDQWVLCFFQALAAILDYMTHLTSISFWYRSDARQDEFNCKLLYCEFQWCEVMTMSVVGSQPNKHTNTSYKATKHIERTFLISDYY